MRGLTCACFLLLAMGAVAQNGIRVQLRFVGALPDHDPPLRVNFETGTRGWLVSRSRVWKTNDGGSSWERVSAPSVEGLSHRIDSVDFSPGRGLALIENRIFETSDGAQSWFQLSIVPLGAFGGETWGLEMVRATQTGWVFGATYRVAPNDQEEPNDVTKLDRNNRRLILEPAIYKTDDGGGSWRRQDLTGLDGASLGFRVTEMSSGSAEHAVAITESSVISTADGGVNWTQGRLFGAGCSVQRAVRDRSQMRLVYLLDDSHGWLSLGDGSLFSTVDGGRKWCEILPPGGIHSRVSSMASYFESVRFISPNVGWGAEVSGGLLETADGGLSWSAASPSKSRFELVGLSKVATGWALADDGLYQLGIAQ